MKKVISYVMLVALVVYSAISINLTGVFAQEDPYVKVFATQIGSSAKSMVVLEGYSNKMLYGKMENEKLAMASTTKIITAIVAIENSPDLDKMVEIDDLAVGIEGTSIYLKKNEKLTIRELLYGLILASGNDASIALAVEVGGNISNFVKMMNDYASSVGAVNTHFDNPHGLDSKTHYTTAKDLALMTSHALKNDVFKEIVSTQYKQITGNEESGSRFLRNKNRLTFSQQNNVGVKTGFTDNAGRCLVNAVEENGMQIITVLLNCGPMFDEAKRLTDLTIDNYKMKEFIVPYNYVGQVSVENGDKNSANIVTIKGFKLPILKINEDKFRVVYDIPNQLQAPVTKDTSIGGVKVYFNEEIIFEDNLYCIDEIKNINIRYMLNNILENWF